MTRPSTRTLCLLLVFGCSSRVDVAKSNLGGATGIGVTTGGVYGGTGGAPWLNPTGGASWASTGGRWPSASGGAASVSVGGAMDTLTHPCTPGADQTCNDDPAASSLFGHCEEDHTCTCNADYVINFATYKCNTPDQTVCYSPTQNIDKAYVDRAFGCNCNPSTSTPYCGIDSSGLRVYLACTSSGKWQSGDTTQCN